jgi:NADH-quinone oxidoreductase subunit C
LSPAELADQIRGRWPDALLSREEVMVVVDRDELVATLQHLRDTAELRFDLFLGVTASDWPGADPRYWLDYELYSTPHRHRVRVKVGLTDADPHVPSVTPLFPGADWHERETFDFFGVVFDGHPDLRRIMLPEGWEGHPLRKTEELGGVNTRYKNEAFIPPPDRRTL